MPTQSNLSFTFALDNGPSFDVVRFRLRERASKPFRLTLDLSSQDAKVDLDHLIDSPATFAIHDGDTVVRYVHGMVTQFDQDETGFRRTRYRAVVMPDLMRCDLRSNCRIFQQKTAMEIITLLLKEAGIQRVRFDLGRRQPGVREYCVQYRETDLEFVERIAADEGFYYNFEHDAHSHTVVFSDCTEHAARVGHIPYQPNAGGDAPGASLRRFSYSRRLRPTHQVLRERYFKDSRWIAELQREGMDLGDGAQYEAYDYPGLYKDTATGRRKVLNRIAYERRDARRAKARGDSPLLQPGVSFDLDGHPREELNTGWFVVSVRHEGEQPTSQGEESTGGGTHYANRAKLVPWNREWKPRPRLKPRISGTQVADVVGPKGEVVFCDEYGRVKVQFPWDREGAEDENASCWIRVAQNWSGATFGHMAVPRIGQEVLVAFNEGDPDQPIIVGRNPNCVNLPPFQLPGAKNMMVLRSNEINGRRNNHFILDDTPGEIQAQLSSDHQLSQLNLGFITRVPYWSGRKDKRGEGFELRTDGHGVMRAAHGMLVTTEGRANASGHVKEMGETVQRLTQAREQHEDLSKLAQQHKAQPLEANQDDVTLAIKAQNDAIRGGPTSGGTAQPELTAPHMVFASAAGLGFTAAQSTHLASQRDLAITTGRDASLSVGRSLLVAVRDAVSVFAYRLGIKLFAAKGKVEIQAHSDNIELTAQKTIKVVSVAETIEIEAKQEILLTSGGAYIRIKDGNIEISAPGKVDIKGKCLISAPGSASNSKLALSQAEGIARTDGRSRGYSD